jgi:hypothetical protein
VAVVLVAIIDDGLVVEPDGHDHLGLEGLHALQGLAQHQLVPGGIEGAGPHAVAVGDRHEALGEAARRRRLGALGVQQRQHGRAHPHALQQRTSGESFVVPLVHCSFHCSFSPSDGDR